MKKVVYIGPELEVDAGNVIFKKGVAVEVQNDLIADALCRNKGEFELAKEVKKEESKKEEAK